MKFRIGGQKYSMLQIKSSVVWSICGILVFTGSILYVFYASNPQWSKYIYVFQSQMLKRNIYPPENYTGIWREWHPNFQLAHEAIYKEGKLIDSEKEWSSDGALVSQIILDGEKIIDVKMWNSKTKKLWYHKDYSTGVQHVFNKEDSDVYMFLSDNSEDPAEKAGNIHGKTLEPPIRQRSGGSEPAKPSSDDKSKE